MSNLCNIIKDLLPLYYDDVCSIDTKIMVEEHLKECNECKQYLNSLGGDFTIKDLDVNVEQASVKSFKKLRKKFLRKNIIISVTSIIVSFIIILGGFSYSLNKEIPIEYNSLKLDITQSYNEDIDCTLENQEFYHTSHIMVKMTEERGVKIKKAYVYLADNIWTRYFVKPKYEAYGFTLGKEFNDDFEKNMGKVDQIYYLVGDYNKFVSMSDEEFDEKSKNAVLIWEK